MVDEYISRIYGGMNQYMTNPMSFEDYHTSLSLLHSGGMVG